MAQTISVQVFDARPRMSMAVWKIDWACDAASPAFSQPLGRPINGSLMHIVTKPGTTAPTDNSDVVLVGQDGLDKLAGFGADAIDNGTTNSIATMTEATVSGRYYGVNPSISEPNPTLTITNNAVNGAKGTIWLYLR